MKIRRSICSIALLLACSPWSLALAQPLGSIELKAVGQYKSAATDEGAAEIAAYDSVSRRLFVVNAVESRIDALDISRPWAPTLVFSIDITPYGSAANSVAINNGVIATAIESDDRQAPGSVAFFDASGRFLRSVIVGALPDMLIFTPDGSRLLVANEGEPDGYCETGLSHDPEGSVSVIDLSPGISNLTQAQVATAGFSAFNGAAPEGVRVFGPNATVAQDLEPEFITVSRDSSTAWITLQENNAIAVLDVATATITSIVPLGYKDHSQQENAFDSSNRDGAIRIVPWPVRGLYQPDSIASYTAGGSTFLVTANEGDARDYECYSEEERVGDLTLDATVFPNAQRLQADENLGRLKTTTANGDNNQDGAFEHIYSYGARSFSIWNSAGELVYDSGRDFESMIAATARKRFNSQGAITGEFDNRSDDKGPEPEGVAIGRFRSRWYAFIGLERVGGIMVYDITEPARPFFVQYANNVSPDGSPEVGSTLDLAPEGILFIHQADSPTGRALLVVSSEDSNTVTLYTIQPSIFD